MFCSCYILGWLLTKKKKVKMEQSSLSDLMQGLTLMLRNVARSVTNTLRGESLIKYIQPLIRRENGGYKAWLEEMQKYFHVARVAEEDKR